MKSVDFTILKERAWDAISGLAALNKMPVPAAIGALLNFWNGWSGEELEKIVLDERARAKKDGTQVYPTVTVTDKEYHARWVAAAGLKYPVPSMEHMRILGFLEPLGDGKWRVRGMGVRLGYFLKRNERDGLTGLFSKVSRSDWDAAAYLLSRAEVDAGEEVEARCMAIGSILLWRREFTTRRYLEESLARSVSEKSLVPKIMADEEFAFRRWKNASKGTPLGQIDAKELVVAGLIGESVGGVREILCARDSGELVGYANVIVKRVAGMMGGNAKNGRRGYPPGAIISEVEYNHYKNFLKTKDDDRRIFIPREYIRKYTKRQIHSGAVSVMTENYTISSRTLPDKDIDKDNILSSGNVDGGEKAHSARHVSASPTPKKPNQIRLSPSGMSREHSVAKGEGLVKKYHFRAEVESLSQKMAQVYAKSLGVDYLVSFLDQKAISNWLKEYPEISNEKILSVWETGIRSAQWPKIRNIREILNQSNWNYYSPQSVKPEIPGAGATTLPPDTNPPSSAPVSRLAPPLPSGEALGGVAEISPPSEQGEPLASQRLTEAEIEADRRVSEQVAAAHRDAPNIEKRVADLTRRGEELMEFLVKPKELEGLDGDDDYSSEPLGSVARREKYQKLLERKDELVRSALHRNGRIQRRANRNAVALQLFGADAAFALCRAPETAAVRATSDWAFHHQHRRGLLLCGPQGTGKTFAAKLFGFSMHSKQLSESANADSVIRVLPAASLSGVGTFKPEERDFWTAVKRARVLVIDDLGKEAVNKVWLQNLFEVLDVRQLSGGTWGWKTIITSNLSPELLRVRYGEAIFERMVALCEVVNVKSVARYEIVEPKVNEGNLRAVLRDAVTARMKAVEAMAP